MVLEEEMYRPRPFRAVGGQGGATSPPLRGIRRISTEPSLQDFNVPSMLNLRPWGSGGNE
jgi:hypothetical protein